MMPRIRVSTFVGSALIAVILYAFITQSADAATGAPAAAVNVTVPLWTIPAAYIVALVGWDGSRALIRWWRRGR